MSKKPPSMDFTVADVKRLLQAVRRQRANCPEEESSTWDALVVKLQKLLSLPDKPKVFDAAKALCVCGHSLLWHQRANQHPCTYGWLENGPACECRDFVPCSYGFGVSAPNS